ncbi:hypothetical protein R1flu_007040 [Riccia fluitans]|uniref:Uncharacterized protein n=1 Tax=Riccia fluitans TaxID=41844 RepID=A0ABD1YXR4_9MARC
MEAEVEDGVRTGEGGGGQLRTSAATAWSCTGSIRVSTSDEVPPHGDRAHMSGSAGITRAGRRRNNPARGGFGIEEPGTLRRVHGGGIVNE